MASLPSRENELNESTDYESSGDDIIPITRRNLREHKKYLRTVERDVNQFIRKNKKLNDVLDKLEDECGGLEVDFQVLSTAYTGAEAGHQQLKNENSLLREQLRREKIRTDTSAAEAEDLRKQLAQVQAESHRQDRKRKRSEELPEVTWGAELVERPKTQQHMDVPKRKKHRSGQKQRSKDMKRD